MAARVVTAKEIKDEAGQLYCQAFSLYRSGYREGYTLALGDPAWNAQLEHGFMKGFITTPRTLRHGISSLSESEAAAHIKTTAALSDMKRGLTKVYDHYIETINIYVEVDEAYRLAMAENKDARNPEP
jgi:hypothetical protein